MQHRPIAPLFLLLAACGGDPPCDETKTCNVNADPTGGGGRAATSSTASAGGTTSSTSGTGGAGGMGTGGMGAGGMGTGGMGTGGMMPDTTPPTVVSVSPADGALGQTDDAKLTITFSEPMQQVDAQQAFQSNDFAAANLTWLDASTLEIETNGLAYASGGPTVMANVYTWKIASTAKDLAGNPMTADYEADFATLREITDNPPLTYQNAINGSGTTTQCLVPGGGKFIGSRNATSCVALVSFDLSVIPPGADVQSSNLTCSRVSINGDPFAFYNTGADVEHVSYPSNNLSLAFSSAPLSVVGPGFTSLTDVFASVNAKNAVVSELTQMSNEIQFRFRFNSIFTSIADNNIFFHSPSGTTKAGCENDALTVVYRLP